MSKFSFFGCFGGNSVKENIISVGGLFKKGFSSVVSIVFFDCIDLRFSIGDFEDLGDEVMGVLVGVLGKSYECSSFGLGFMFVVVVVKGMMKEGGMVVSRWLSSFGKKGKKNNENIKESFDLERVYVGGELDGLVEEKV